MNSQWSSPIEDKSTAGLTTGINLDSDNAVRYASCNTLSAASKNNDSFPKCFS